MKRCFLCLVDRYALRRDCRVPVPSTQQLTRLHERVTRRYGSTTLKQRESHKRKISKAFARELRRRNWLAPEREGYASVPGNWSAQ